jgi:type I restriction enzyme S subunit
MVPIGEVCNIFDGPHATPKKIEKGPIYLGIDAITPNGKLNPNEFNHLSEHDYKKWTKRVTPQYGDLVFSYEATLGRYAIIPRDFYGCLGRRLAIVRPKDERINIKWLYYYFLSPEWSATIENNTVKGSTVNRISIDEFPNFKIPYLEREEQDKIVRILAPIDEKIDNNTRINDNLAPHPCEARIAA